MNIVFFESSLKPWHVMNTLAKCVERKYDGDKDIAKSYFLIFFQNLLLY